MINSFQGKYRWLSNFWLCEVIVDENIFPSSEHAYQAQKAQNTDEYFKIAEAKTPAIAKRLGAAVNHPYKTVQHQIIWDRLRLDWMFRAVIAKFIQNKDLKEKLIATGDQELIEGNTWGDTFWGVCNGVGGNNLGKILMQVRSELNERR